MVEFAFGADGTTVGEHDVLGDGEAEAGAAGFAGAGFVDAVEAFEEARQMLGGNARAEILNIKFNPEFDATLGRARTQQDASASAAVLHRVVDQVGKDLVDGFAVGADRGQGFDGAADLRLVSTICRSTSWLRAISRKLSSASWRSSIGRNGFGIEAGLAGFDAREGQQVFGEARHAGSVLADDFQKLAVGSGIFGAEVEESFGVSLNGSQGSAEFVRDVGNEIAASFFDALGFGEIAEHGDGAAIGQGSGGDVEGAAGNDGGGASGLHLLWWWWRL